MPINKLALVRYKTIDSCLQNRFRKWTLEDLMEACSESLYEYEGITKGISKRAIQLDIQNMRSEKLGYNAPIVVTDKKFYSYNEKNYSITNTPITQQDLGTLNEVLHILKQFNGFGYFQELDGMVTRLEDKLLKQQQKGKSHIEFEKNELLKGLNHIDPLHRAIINKKTIEVTYQSFKARVPSEIIYYPYLLKEYRNRWFLLGYGKKARTTMILALDRIEKFTVMEKEKFQKPDFDVNAFFKDVIGVTKSLNDTPKEVVLKIAKEHAPYVLTKPIHPSQKILKTEPDGVIFSLEVILNYELEREIMGFGEQLKVLSPRRLSGRIQSKMKQALAKYKEEA